MNNLFKFSAQGMDLATFIGNGTKVKILSEIKPPLVLTGGKQNKLNYLIIFISGPDWTISTVLQLLSPYPLGASVNTKGPS